MIQIKSQTGIVHIRAGAELRLRNLLLDTDLSPLSILVTEELIDEWLHYGSVYADGVRLRADTDLAKDQIVRLHTRRKTYVTRIPLLRESLVFENDDFLVLNKPAGLPTHATLDNYIENAAYLLSQELNIPLFVTHRLDVPTNGLLILAKTPAAQAGLNKLFSKGRVTKIYRAQTSLPVPLGEHTHWMNPESRVPKKMSSTPMENWWTCKSIVQSCAETPAGEYLSTVQLLTGKTHQIRAQFRTLGAPILGDTVYGGAEKNKADTPGIGLQCYQLHLRWKNADLTFRVPAGPESPPKFEAR